MRRSLLLLLAIAALAAPSATLAADPTPATIRYFVVNGMVLGDQKFDAQGKMLIEGDRFTGSVGCNTIGGTVTTDGVTIKVSDLMSTEMACDGALGAAEKAFVTFLTSGAITLAPDQWSTDAGMLVVMDGGLQPEPVPSGDPDGTVTSPPDPGFSLDSCIGILPADEFPSRIDGSSGSGSGSSGSGGSSTGTGTTTPGSGGTEPMPVETPGAVDGGPAPAATDTSPAEPPPAVDVTPLPIDPPVVVDPTAVPDPSPVLIDPLPIDPGVVVEPTPVPGGTTPTLEQCRELVSRIRTLGAPTDGAANAGGEAAPMVDKSASDTTPVAPFAATILVLGAAAFVLWRRSRRDGETSEADAG